MLQTRIMPCLLLLDGRLVKTVRFRKPAYVGDPVNAIKIFNGKEVDELLLLDIAATLEGRSPDTGLLREVTDECFMPLCYGGGVRTVNQMRALFSLGIEKIALNTAAFEDPDLVRQAAGEFGSQSVVVSLDAGRNLFGRPTVRIRSGRRDTGRSPADCARRMEDLGAGEILLTSIDRDGTWSGYDIDLVREVARAVTLPVIAGGGAGRIGDFATAVRGGAAACAAGSMAVYQGKNKGVLINFPSRADIVRVLEGGDASP